MNTNTDQTPTARQITPVTDEQFEASCIIVSRWMMEHPEMHNLVLEKRIASGVKKAVEFATQAPEEPATPDKWQAEREHFSKGGRVQFRAATVGPWADFLPAFKQDQPTWGAFNQWRIHPDDEVIPDGCNINPLSSRMCERGTKSCEAQHSVEAPAAQEKARQDNVLFGGKQEAEKCPTCGSGVKPVLSSIAPCPDPWHNPQPPQEKRDKLTQDALSMFNGPSTTIAIGGLEHATSKPPQEKWEPRFKVGDRVRQKKGGEICTIAEIVEGSRRYRLASYHRGVLFRERELEPAPWSLPTPPAGQQWDRQDWTQDMLPEGFRPLLLGELLEEGDEFCRPHEKSLWLGTNNHDANNGRPSMGYWYRTRRPLPPTDNPSRILTPEELTKLCGNQPPHRTDGWKAEWLPSGWRPLLLGEECQRGDECRITGGQIPPSGWEPLKGAGYSLGKADASCTHIRTRRPAPTQPATAKTGADFENWWFNANTKTPITEHSMAHARDGWNAAIDFASSAETQENLIAPDESNVRYWTQRIMDMFEGGGFYRDNIEKVIRELLTKDTHYAAMEDAHLVLDNDPSKIIRNAKDGYPEGRADRVLTLAERVKALCRYAADYKGWLEESEAKVKQLEEQLAKLDALLVQSIEHNKGIIQSLDACQKFHEAIAAREK